jgi:hypothetical protein
MQSLLRSQVSGWVGVAGAAGVLVSLLMLTGCPGTLDPALFNTTGTGGSKGTGGTTGSGGSGSNCTGANDPAAIITTNCASLGCHDSSGAQFSGGLNLVVDATIGSRLVDVTTVGTADNGSSCVGNPLPYLQGGSNPATGLLIDKIQSSPKCTANSACCGLPMPSPGIQLLPAQQQTCLIQWATTLTSP